MHKKVILILVILALSIAITAVPVNANPYREHKSGVLPPGITAPKISITTPTQDMVYSNNGTINLQFSVTAPNAPNILTRYLTDVAYQGDWMVEPNYVYRTKNHQVYTPDDFPDYLAFNLNITSIPAGKHNLNITAYGAGGYADGLTWYQFDIKNSTNVNFSIDKAPVIRFLSFENRTFSESTVPLNFTVDQPTTKFSYILDGETAVDIDGNTTLTGLTDGYHNLTVQAINEFKTAGISETISFSIEAKQDIPQEQSPALLVALVGISIAVGCVGLFYLKKRKA